MAASSQLVKLSSAVADDDWLPFGSMRTKLMSAPSDSKAEEARCWKLRVNAHWTDDAQDRSASRVIESNSGALSVETSELSRAPKIPTNAKGRGA